MSARIEARFRPSAFASSVSEPDGSAKSSTPRASSLLACKTALRAVTSIGRCATKDGCGTSCRQTNTILTLGGAATAPAFLLPLAAVEDARSCARSRLISASIARVMLLIPARTCAGPDFANSGDAGASPSTSIASTRLFRFAWDERLRDRHFQCT